MAAPVEPSSSARDGAWAGERLPDEIRTMSRYGYRSGEWAKVVGVVNVNGRACWRVAFPDGPTDDWVINDPGGRYEFR